MKILDPGHTYLVNSLGGGVPEILKFVKRKGPGYPGNASEYPGTTTQEVCRALIDRAEYVNGQQSCWQTRLSVWLFRVAIWLYEHRAAKRHKRKAPGFFSAVNGITCRACGHVGCDAVICGR